MNKPKQNFSPYHPGGDDSTVSNHYIFEVKDVIVPSGVATPIYLGGLDDLPLGTGVLTFYTELTAPVVETIYLQVEEFGFGEWDYVDNQAIVSVNKRWGVHNYGSGWTIGDNQDYTLAPPESIKWRFAIGHTPPSVAPLTQPIHIVRLRVGVLLV